MDYVVSGRGEHDRPKWVVGVDRDEDENSTPPPLVKAVFVVPEDIGCGVNDCVAGQRHTQGEKAECSYGKRPIFQWNASVTRLIVEIGS